MKKIRSGQVYLYRDGGIQSTVFEIRMKEMSQGDLLRRALENGSLKDFMKNRMYIFEKFYTLQAILSYNRH